MAIPSLAPLQEMLVLPAMKAESAPGCVRVTATEAVHPFASVTVAVCTPAASAAAAEG